MRISSLQLHCEILFFQENVIKKNGFLIHFPLYLVVTELLFVTLKCIASIPLLDISIIYFCKYY